MERIQGTNPSILDQIMDSDSPRSTDPECKKCWKARQNNQGIRAWCEECYEKQFAQQTRTEAKEESESKKCKLAAYPGNGYRIKESNEP